MSNHTFTHLDVLESESIHIMREVAAECKNPALLFSGGKDSIVMLRLAEKAFRPARFPFPLVHIDTGHNFPEVIATRDKLAADVTRDDVCEGGLPWLGRDAFDGKAHDRETITQSLSFPDLEVDEESKQQVVDDPRSGVRGWPKAPPFAHDQVLRARCGTLS
mgnify:CR=1 FL=1